MIDVDMAARAPPRMHASELAPPVYAAERLQQLHIGGSGEAHKRTSPSSRSPERRLAAAAAMSAAGGSGDALVSPPGGVFDGTGVAIGGACGGGAAAAAGDDGWRIPAAAGAGAGAQASDGDGDGGAAAQAAEAEIEPPEPFSWTKGELIGIGAFGRVFTGLNNVTGEIIAVKQVRTRQNALPRCGTTEPHACRARRPLRAGCAHACPLTKARVL